MVMLVMTMMIGMMLIYDDNDVDCKQSFYFPWSLFLFPLIGQFGAHS